MCINGPPSSLFEEMKIKTTCEIPWPLSAPRAVVNFRLQHEGGNKEKENDSFQKREPPRQQLYKYQSKQKMPWWEIHKKILIRWRREITTIICVFYHSLFCLDNWSHFTLFMPWKCFGRYNQRTPSGVLYPWYVATAFFFC